MSKTNTSSTPAPQPSADDPSWSVGQPFEASKPNQGLYAPHTVGGEVYATGAVVITGESQVHHPSHYQGKNGIEVIDFIEDHQLGFNLGNAVKYIARAGRKEPAKKKQDLEKAIWYVRRAIDKNTP